ncbi:MarR family winged helix-turn-helix transcriptional regulator [Murimonas intestini]|uniref:MarR family winged helix-turn-helix transcriptional regulator n=1 Tax=Murimonas intestini TaxID=1337051 RepID=UPI0011DE46FE|nr:MarR family transcriptional regulator [Murimonas intestini]
MRDMTEVLMSGQRLRRLYEKVIGQVCSEYGLGRNEVDILLFLVNNPGYDTAKDIVEYRGLAKSCVSKGIDILVKKKYLDVRSDKEDRRLVHIQVRKEAEPVCRAAQNAQKRCLEIMYRGVSPEEREAFEKITKKFAENIREAVTYDN